jgi:hypothetical protein
MKRLARAGAGLSFTFFLLGGVAILTKTDYSGEYVVLIALGLFLVGTAFFVGPMLWLAAEKCGSKQGGK